MVFDHSRHEQRQVDLSRTKQRSTHIVGWHNTAATHKNSVITGWMRCKESVKLRPRPGAGYRAAFGNRRVDLSGTYEIGSAQARSWIVAALDGNDRAPPWRRNCEHPQVIRNRDAGIEMRVRSHGGELGRPVAFLQMVLFRAHRCAPGPQIRLPFKPAHRLALPGLFCITFLDPSCHYEW
jgi:hypothetical protein